MLLPPPKVLTITQCLVEQTPYRHGAVLADAEFVKFNNVRIGMLDHVDDPGAAAFTRHISQREKYTIRIRVSFPLIIYAHRTSADSVLPAASRAARLQTTAAQSTT